MRLLIYCPPNRATGSAAAPARPPAQTPGPQAAPQAAPPRWLAAGGRTLGWQSAAPLPRRQGRQAAPGTAVPPLLAPGEGWGQGKDQDQGRGHNQCLSRESCGSPHLWPLFGWCIALLALAQLSFGDEAPAQHCLRIPVARSKDDPGVVLFLLKGCICLELEADSACLKQLLAAWALGVRGPIMLS